MAKIYNEPIDPNSNIDWGVGDESTGNKPLSGAVVQKFIKDNISLLKNRAHALEENVNGVPADPEHETPAVPGLLDRVESIENTVNGDGEGSDGLSDRMSAVEATVNGTEGADGLSDRMSAVEGRLNDIDGQEGALADLDERMDQAEEDISDLQEDVSDLQDTTSEMQETLNNIDPAAIEAALEAFDPDVLDARFQDIYDILDGKAGYFYKDTNRNIVLVFADEDSYEEWSNDNTKDYLILGTFDAPALYEGRINLIGVNTDTYVNYIQYGSKGNRVQATYEIVHISDSQVQPEGVAATVILKDINRTVLFETTQNVSVGGTIDVNIDDYIVNGTNTVTVRINSTETHTTASISYTIIASELILSDTFDINPTLGTNSFIVEPDGILNIAWSVRGNGTKYIKWFIDGDDKYPGTNISIPIDSTSDVPVGSGTKQIPMSYFTQGKHTIQYYAYVELGTAGSGNYFYSNVLYRDFIVDTAVRENSELSLDYLAILTKFEAPADIEGSIIVQGTGTELDPIVLNGVTQYEPKNISYCVYYKDQSDHKDVTITFNSTDEENRPVVETSNHSASSLTRVDDYSIRSFYSGASSLVLECVNDAVYFNVPVAQSTYNLSNNTANLAFAFSGSDRDNASTNRDTWSYTNKAGTEYTGRLTNFNWIENSGWNGGRLIFSNQAEFATTYQPFHRTGNNSIRDNGLTFEIEFETRRVLDEDAVILDLRDENTQRGLLITASEIRYTTDASDKTVYTKYKPEENVRLTLVINPYTGQSSYHGILMMYIDGVLTGLVDCGPNDTFESEKELVITGIPEASIVVKQIRCYERPLSVKEVLDNYILYRDTAEELLQAYDRNNIYVENVVSSDKLAEKTPIIIITGPLNILHGFNKDFKKTYVRMEKLQVINPDPAYNMVLKDLSMRCQGTSSMEYPIKNFRFYTQKDSEDKTYNPKDTAGNEYTTLMYVGGNNPETDGVELTGKKRKYSFKEGAQPVKCWCLKADYAESSSTHNTGIARLWNQMMRDVEIPAADVSPKYYIQPSSQSGKFNICQTIAQRKAREANYPYDVRTTVDGFPISLFFHEHENDPLQFVGRYNWNNDKSTESVYGFCDIPGFDTDLEEGDVDYGPTMECWEVIEGDFPANLFTFDDTDPMKWNDKNDSGNNGWMKSFEARYPDDAGDPSEAHRARNTIEQVDVPVWETDPNTSEQILDPETGEPIPVWVIDPETGDPVIDEETGEPIQETTKEWVSCEPGALYRVCKWIHDTMGASVVGNDGKMTPVSPNDPRMIKFKTEKWNYLDIYKLAAYYCYLMRFGAVDQVVKNAMFTTEDGLHWYYINYDNDTINGVKNDGSLVFGYKIDRQSREYEGGPFCYAGHESVLWNNLEADDEFMDIVREIDNALYEKGLTYTNVIKMFNEEQSAKWSERTHNEDYVYKYIGPYIKDGNNQFAKLQGPRKSHRQWWLSNRFAWMDALNGVGSYKESLISIKPNTQRVRQGDGVTISSSSSEQVFGYSWGNSMRDNNRSAEVGTDIVFNFNQQDTYYIGAELKFYNPVFMTKFDMSRMSYAAQEIMFNKVNTSTFDTTLTEVILGTSEISDYNRAPNIKIDGLDKIKYLETFRMNKFATITAIDLSENKYLKKVDLRYCDKLKDIVLPTGAPITELKYPGNVESLVLRDLVYLTNFELDSYSSVKTINITGCPNLTRDQSLVFNWLNQKTTADRYCSIKLDNISWTNVTNTQLNRLITFINNGGTIDFRGHIRMLDRINDATFAHNIENAFGGPNIFKSTSSFYIQVDPTVLIEGPDVVLEGDRGEYTIYYIGNDESRPYGDPAWEILSQLIDRRAGTEISQDAQGHGWVSTTENAQPSKNLEIRVYLGSGSGSIYGDKTLNIKKRTYPSADLGDVYIDGKNNVTQGNNRYDIKYTNNNIDGAMYAEWTIEGALANWCTVTSLGVDGMDGCILNMPTLPHGSPAEDYLVVNGSLVVTLYYKNYPTPDAETHSVVGNNGIKSLTIGYKDPSIAVSAATNPYAMAALVNVPNGKVPNAQLLTVVQAGRISHTELQPGSSFATSIFRTGNFYNNCTSFDEFEYFTGLSEIPTYLFYQCTKLESIVLPSSITKISSYAFSGCNSLKSITIPKNVTEIETGAFTNCKALTTVIFEEDTQLRTIGSNVFQGCTKLKNIVLPDTVTSMSSYVFQGCTQLQTINIPDGVTTINYETFSGCTSLSNVQFNNNLTRIETSAFVNTAMVNLTIPDSVTYIGSSAFSSCTRLKTVNIGNGVSSMGSNTFQNCTALESIVFGNALTAIPSQVCWGCSALKSVHFGASVNSFPYPGICAYTSAYNNYYSGSSNYQVDNTTIRRGWSNESFSGCINIETITIDEANTTFYDGRSAAGGNAVITRSNNRMIMGCKTTTIPSSCASIAGTAFERLPGLESINIPAEVRTIEQYAFLNCPDLEEVTFDDNSSLGSISRYAFYRCPRLAEMHLPNMLTSIAEYAFGNDTEMMEVTFGSRLTSIGGYAFTGCLGLSSVTIPQSVTSMGEGVFNACSYLQTLTFGGTSHITNIPSYFCRYCGSLQAISIPNSVTSISSQAFYGCGSLESLIIGSGVQSIADNAFRSDATHKLNLSEIIIDPENELYIDGRSFSGSNCIISLQTRTLILGCKNTVIPNISPLALGQYSFAYVSGMAVLSLPSTVQSIERSAFQGCTGIGKVITNNGIVSIAQDAFRDCTSIYIVDLGINTGTIGQNAFYGCTSLKIVISRNTYAPALSSGVFSGGVSLQRIYVSDQTAYNNHAGDSGWSAYNPSNTVIDYPIPNEYNS